MENVLKLAEWFLALQWYVWMCRLKQICMVGKCTRTQTQRGKMCVCVYMYMYCIWLCIWNICVYVCYFQFMFKLVSVFWYVLYFFSVGFYAAVCDYFLLSFLFLYRFWFRLLTDIPYLFQTKGRNFIAYLISSYEVSK